MKLEMVLCDTCQAELTVLHPLRLSASPQCSATGEWLSADFCSTACLRLFVEAMAVKQ